jgi:hypothetical protein
VKTRQSIDQFLSAAHRLAFQRLRSQPERKRELTAVLRRWREQRGPTRSDAYFDEWEKLLTLPLDEVENLVCADTEHAAALRSTSPIAPLITAAERDALLKQTRRS